MIPFRGFTSLNRQKHPESPESPINFLRQWCFLIVLVLVVVCLSFTECTVHQVFTYKNTSTSLGQLVTSSTLVWETYDPKDSKQLQYAVEGGKYVTEDEHYPIYVCRVTIDGVATSGHTEKVMQVQVCVAAHYKNSKYKNFDVLLNKGHLGKVSWRYWRKFMAGVPVGAIRTGSMEDAYIARHRIVNGNDDQRIQEGADYNLGRLEPVGLGKIKVMDNDRERDYDEGEVLVETEPYRYELRDIRLDHLRLDTRENVTELAHGVLANNGDGYSLVETVLTYGYDHIQYWGAHEGVARGLPTKVYEMDSSLPAEINWGLRHSEKRFETKSVHTKLWPGTALNVTIRGNYVSMAAPYTAKLFAFYYGSEDRVSRKITAEVRKSYLKDVKMDFSPVYWLSNGSLVPTTMAEKGKSSSSSGVELPANPIPIPNPNPDATTTLQASRASENELRPAMDVIQDMDMDAIPLDGDSLKNSLLNAPPPPVSNEIMEEQPGNLAENHEKPLLASIGMIGSAENVASSPNRSSRLLPIFTTMMVFCILDLMQRRSHHHHHHHHHHHQL